MTQDESAIRDVVNTWFTATKSGDLPAVLDLMTDDVIFMAPRQPPFGKKEFAAASEPPVRRHLRHPGSPSPRQLGLPPQPYPHDRHAA